MYDKELKIKNYATLKTLASSFKRTSALQINFLI